MSKSILQYSAQIKPRNKNPQIPPEYTAHSPGVKGAAAGVWQGGGVQ